MGNHLHYFVNWMLTEFFLFSGQGEPGGKPEATDQLVKG